MYNIRFINFKDKLKTYFTFVGGIYVIYENVQIHVVKVLHTKFHKEH